MQYICLWYTYIWYMEISCARIFIKFIGWWLITYCHCTQWSVLSLHVRTNEWTSERANGSKSCEHTNEHENAIERGIGRKNINILWWIISSIEVRSLKRVLSPKWVTMPIIHCLASYEHVFARGAFSHIHTRIHERTHTLEWIEFCPVEMGSKNNQF